MDLKIIKKNGTKVNYNVDKIINAVTKSAERVLIKLSDEDKKLITLNVMKSIADSYADVDGTDLLINVLEMHKHVENALDQVNPKIAKSYREYRNYKTDFIKMLDEVYIKSKSIMYVGDRDNANSDSTLTSTQQSLIRGEFTKSIYDKFYMSDDERQACQDGFIYIHDKKDRIFSTNCCIFDIKTVLEGGFHSCNFDYTEPKTITAACAVVKNIIMMGAAQQYGK